MKKRMWTRLLSAVLSLAICFIALPAHPAMAAGALHYGEVPIWTGAIDVDYQAEQILKEIPTEGKSKVEQIRAVYDWVVRNCKRDNWDGTYYFDEDEVYEKCSGTFLEEANEALRSGKLLLRTDYALENAPSDNYFMAPVDSNEYITTFAYDMMLTRTGTCAHYSALLSVLLGHLGFDCRLIDGEFLNRNGTRVEHKWNYVLVDGKYYWMDPRIENANYERTGSIDHIYFMKEDTAAWAASHAWDQTYSNWLAANTFNIINDYNAELEAAANTVYHTITVFASRSGKVSGAGTYAAGDTVELNATPVSGKSFDGWYDANGTLLSSDKTYTFTVTGPITIYAMFEGDLFYDLNGQWYVNNAMRAAQMGLTTGNGAFQFDGDSTMTRAMAVLMLSKIDNANLNRYTSSQFTDVEAGEWYASAIAWAYNNHLVSGRNAYTFDPNGQISREEFMTIMNAYFNYKNVTVPTAQLNFTDVNQISSWAYEPVQKALSAGLTTGYTDHTFRPHNKVTRAEGVTILLKLYDFLQSKS